MNYLGNPQETKSEVEQFLEERKQNEEQSENLKFYYYCLGQEIDQQKSSQSQNYSDNIIKCDFSILANHINGIYKYHILADLINRRCNNDIKFMFPDEFNRFQNDDIVSIFNTEKLSRSRELLNLLEPEKFIYVIDKMNYEALCNIAKYWKCEKRNLDHYVIDKFVEYWKSKGIKENLFAYDIVKDFIKNKIPERLRTKIREKINFANF